MSDKLRLRPAAETDGQLLLMWRNDPETRAASRNTDEVQPDEHMAWLRSVLPDPDRHLLIVELQGEPVGQIRFDRTRGYRYELSVSLESGSRGRGLGIRTLRDGCEWLWAHTHAVAVDAAIRQGNEASGSAFLGAGFRPAGEGGGEWLLFTLERPEPWAPKRTGTPGDAVITE